MTKADDATTAAKTGGILLFLAVLSSFFIGPPDFVQNWEECRNGTDCFMCLNWDRAPNAYWNVVLEPNASREDTLFYKKSTWGRVVYVQFNPQMFIDTNPSIRAELMVPTTKALSTDQLPDGRYIRPVKFGDKIERGRSESLCAKAIKLPEQEVVWKIPELGVDPIWQASESGVYTSCIESVAHKITRHETGKPVVLNHPNGTKETRDNITAIIELISLCTKSEQFVRLGDAVYKPAEFKSVKENASAIIIEGDDANGDGKCTYPAESDCSVFNKADGKVLSYIRPIEFGKLTPVSIDAEAIE